MILPKTRGVLPRFSTLSNFSNLFLPAVFPIFEPNYLKTYKKEKEGIYTRARGDGKGRIESVEREGNRSFGNRRPRTDERYVEKVFTNEARRHGAWALKFTSPGTAGVPDRIVILPDGEVRFVEIKRPGGRPSAIQARVFERFRTLGHPVDVIDTPEAARAWWGSL